MRKQFAACMVIILILFSSCTNDAFNKKDPVEITIKTLASDKFKGRLTGTDGNDKAAEYLAKCCRDMGLEPYRDESYYMEYKQDVMNPDKQQCALSVEFEDGSTKKCKLGTDYLVSDYVREMDESLEITFDANDPESSQKALVEDTSGASAQRTSTPRCRIAISSNFFYTIPGIAETPKLQISEALYDEMKTKKAKTIRISMKSNMESAVVKNVIGKISGKNNKAALVLSAHFDHVGWAGSRIYNGAVDNASGVAAVLDIAKRLKERSKASPFNMDILICSINGEEHSLLGSRALVNELTKQYSDLYNINIDSIGKKDGGSLQIIGNRQLNHELIEDMTAFFPENMLNYTDKVGGSSDHAPFNEKNICGITIVQDKLWGEKGIHTSNDMIEMVDISRIKSVSDSVYRFITIKDGKLFKLQRDKKYKTPVLPNPKSHPDKATNEAMQEAYKQAAPKLNFDEYEFLEINGFYYWTVNSDPLKSIEAAKGFLPYMKIPDKIGKYSFDGINVYENRIYAPYQKEAPSEESGKVYKRDLSSENIHLVLLYYRNGNSQLKFEIFYSPVASNFWAVGIYDQEDIDIGGVKHFLMKDTKSGNIQGIGRSLEIDGLPYRVGVFKYDISNNNEKLMESKTSEEMLKDLKGLSIDQLVKDLGI